MKFVFLVHYFPPINSTGAKRVEALSKFLAASGHEVSVVTTRKRARDGEFTERVPAGVSVVELTALGTLAASREDGRRYEPMYSAKPSWGRRLKNATMNWLGQLPDPRLPFAMSFAAPWLARDARIALSRADVVVGSTPPWPLLLAALIVKIRFRVPCILDYRDQFSDRHETPGGRLAKWIERVIDRRLASAADQLVTISEPMSRYYDAFNRRVVTIRNGYDPDLMAAARALAEPKAGDGIVIRYMGLVSPGRVPHQLFKALVWLHETHPDRFRRLALEFWGHSGPIAEATARHYPALNTILRYHPSVKYQESLQRMIEADYLLFAETSSTSTLSAQGILTTKLLEYIGSGRPVLAQIAPATIAGRLLRESGVHHLITESVDDFKAKLANDTFYERPPDRFSAVSQSLSRRTQASQFADLASHVVRVRSSK